MSKTDTSIEIKVSVIIFIKKRSQVSVNIYQDRIINSLIKDSLLEEKIGTRRRVNV